MDFTLNDDQLELKQAAHTWLADRFPLDRDWEAQDDRWGELEELGWLEVAEAGLGFVEEALLLEELGYALYPGPYLAHVSGQRHAHGLTFGGDGDISTVDPTRPVGSVEGGWTSYETPRFHAACAAEALGVAQRALDLGVEHAKTRTQFGKPIGTYQAVSHPLAQTYTDVELSRSLVYWAAWCVAEEEQAGSGGGQTPPPPRELPAHPPPPPAGRPRRLRRRWARWTRRRRGQGVRHRGRRRCVRTLDPGARRHRLHLGAPAAPVLQARDLARGLRPASRRPPSRGRGSAPRVGE
jgi:alkylation response protein AidB-like acyl-CoA dehydrogenase